MGVKLGDCTGCLKGKAPTGFSYGKNWTCEGCHEKARALAEAFWRECGVDPVGVLLRREWQ